MGRSRRAIHRCRIHSVAPTAASLGSGASGVGSGGFGSGSWVVSVARSNAGVICRTYASSPLRMSVTWPPYVVAIADKEGCFGREAVKYNSQCDWHGLCPEQSRLKMRGGLRPPVGSRCALRFAVKVAYRLQRLFLYAALNVILIAANFQKGRRIRPADTDIRFLPRAPPTPSRPTSSASIRRGSWKSPRPAWPPPSTCGWRWLRERFYRKRCLRLPIPASGATISSALPSGSSRPTSTAPPVQCPGGAFWS